MKIRKILVLFVLILITYTSVDAQLVIKGEYRSRFQTLHGYKKPVKVNTDALFGFDQRTRIVFDYKNEKFSTRFSLQDARVWGANDLYNGTGTFGNSNALDIYEAYADVKLMGNSSLRVGRQEWNYDDMRILCYRNWWTTGKSYDGLLYKMHNKDKGLFVDFGLSYNNDGPRTGTISTDEYPDRIKTVDFLNIKKKFNDNTYISFIASAIGKQDTSRASNPLLIKGTYGMNFVLNHGKKANDGFAAKFSAYYQNGTDISVASTGHYKKVSAYLIDGQVGFRTMDKKLEIVAGCEIISGKDGKNTDTDYNDIQHNFDLFYTARFPYYGGNINYFINGASGIFGTKSGGLMDPYFKIKFKPSKKGMIYFATFLPSTFTDVYKEMNGTDRVYYDKSLGTNFDVSYTHKFDKSIIFKIGGSYALVSDTKNHMVYGYNDVATQTYHELGQNYFVYTMLIVKPKFFEGKKEEPKDIK